MRNTIVLVESSVILAGSGSFMLSILGRLAIRLLLSPAQECFTRGRADAVGHLPSGKGARSAE